MNFILLFFIALGALSLFKYFETRKLRDKQLKQGSECAQVRLSPIKSALHYPFVLIWFILRYSIFALILLGCQLFGRSKNDVILSIFSWILKITDGNAKTEKLLGELEPRPGDVWICAYSKSGTNFTMQMVNQIARRGSLCTANFTHLMDEVPWPESDVHTPGYAYSYKKAPKFDTVNGLRAVKTHCQKDWIPDAPSLKYICVIRDPKDVALSMHPFLSSTSLGPAVPPLDTVVNMLCTIGFGAVTLPVFIDSYWRARNDPNVLVLFYEDMVRDLDESFATVLHFLDVDLTDEEIEAAKLHTSYKWMKDHDEYFNAGALTPLGDSGRMLRAGKSTGGSKLSDAQRRRIDEYMVSALKELGSDFPYEELYMKKA